ncbi:MAG: PD-(D/E)XK nuclease family protein, partial [Gillisia sp.]
YLILPDSIFNYLARIQDINHWSLQPEKTELVSNYLKFWNRLPEYYQKLRARLLEKHQAYQGLIYRRASEKIDEFSADSAAKYVFLGFNALNNAEQHIIQNMLDKNAKIFWDIDAIHFQDREHDASLFLREYSSTWPYYQKNTFQLLDNSFSSEKNIEIVGVPKNVGQAKYVAEILAEIPGEKLHSTAVVLGEESLLLPLLNSVPSEIEAMNITMGFPLKYSSLSSLFSALFENFQIANNRFYYKNVVAVLSNPILQKILGDSGNKALKKIKEENLTYLSQQKIASLVVEHSDFLHKCFPEKELSPREALSNFDEIVNEIEPFTRKDADSLVREFLFQYSEIFKELKGLVKNFGHIKTIPALQHFFKEIGSTHNIDFQGKPFQGLQLMGMLESRVLDFETVILTSANEGVLPAGKSNNSFIPYELKKEYNLPTYKEKDAVYTYHFYHLLQRAKNIYLLYNTEPDTLMGGEKSRLLTQLEVEKHPNHNISHRIVAPEVPAIQKKLKTIEKTPAILEKIRELAASGFSPSALTTYIRNPIDFFQQYILGIRDEEMVEETVASNTLGTIVHDTLEAFYKPLTGQELSIAHLEDFKNRIPEEVKIQFHRTYSKSLRLEGKNFLIFEVVKRFVFNFLKMEQKELEKGKKIKILEIETKLSAEIEVPGLAFPISIKGKVDRIDSCDGTLRIIDYKTGKVEQKQLEIVDWEDLTTDYDKYAKPFQVLMYADIIYKNNSFSFPAEAGVISFKNLNAGFLKFSEKNKAGKGAIKNSAISESILKNFEDQLKNLLLEICNPNIGFIEKEIKEHGNY